MTKDELSELFDWAARRDAILYAWLRHLILLGSGSLSLLVALRPVPATDPAAAACLKGAWVALGLGILLASVRLYGEVWTEKAKVGRLEKMRRLQHESGGVLPTGPIVCKPPGYILKAEPASYASFAAAVVLLVAAAWRALLWTRRQDS